MGLEHQGLAWADFDMNPKLGTEHFMVVGASGSGKTVLINRLLWSIFENPNSVLQKNVRALIYDPKQEVVSQLMDSSKSKIRILHPFDTRSFAWDISEDIDSPIIARQFSTILVPDNEAGNSSNSFFIDATRDLLTGVFLVFINCAKKGFWTFRDVILGMLYKPYLTALLKQKTREGKEFFISSRLLESYLEGHEETVANIRATINTRLSVYEPVAAVWHHAWQSGRRFSLSRWITSKDILILGNDESARVALDAINQALFKRITEIVLSQPEKTGANHRNGEDFTWIILDEVREAGRLDGLSRLMTKGRSKGACVVLGFQDIDGLRSVYGAEVANEITGQCQNVAILQISNPTTAQWASQLFGEDLKHDRSISNSLATQGNQTLGFSDSMRERAEVFTSNLIYLPKTSPKEGLTGYFRSPGKAPDIDDLKTRLDWNNDIAPTLPHKSTEPNFIARPVEQHYLEPWTQEDWDRLGFDGRVPTLKRLRPEDIGVL